MRAAVIAAAVALLFGLIAAASAVAADPGARPLDGATFRRLDAPTVLWINRTVLAAPLRARQAVARVAPFVEFRQGRPEELSGGSFVTTEVDESGDTHFVVSLSAYDLAHRDDGARLHLMHELGHPVDNGIVTEELRAAFAESFSHAPGFQSCFLQPLGSSQRCVPAAEIFADQFAFFCTGLVDLRSTYLDPPMVDRRVFASLLSRARPGPGTLIDPVR